jgi:glutamyl-tRNA synthetase
MPKLAMPLRVMLVGQTHTPSVDAVLALFSRKTVLERMAKYIQQAGEKSLQPGVVSI